MYIQVFVGIADRGVRNPMKISDIGFLKTEPNRTDLKIQKPKTRFPRFGFQKIDIRGFGTVFHVVSFTIHLPNFRILFSVTVSTVKWGVFDPFQN